MNIEGPSCGFISIPLRGSINPGLTAGQAAAKLGSRNARPFAATFGKCETFPRHATQREKDAKTQARSLQPGGDHLGLYVEKVAVFLGSHDERGAPRPYRASSREALAQAHARGPLRRARGRRLLKPGPESVACAGG